MIDGFVDTSNSHKITSVQSNLAKGSIAPWWDLDPYAIRGPLASFESASSDQLTVFSVVFAFLHNTSCAQHTVQHW